MKAPKNFMGKICFGIAGFFFLAIALLSAIHAHAEAATATFDRDFYCPPSGNVLTDFERAWISVTDTTATTNTLSVVVKNITNGVTTNYLLSRGTTTAGTIPFTTSGTSTQATSTGVGSTFGYVEDYNGLHNFPGLGSSVQGLRLNVGVIPSNGDASSGVEGVLYVTEGNIIQVLVGGSPIGSATVKYFGADDSSITFTTAYWGNSLASGQGITSAADNFFITLVDPNENLNPVMKDVIGFKDGVTLGASDSVSGTGTSRVQIEAIDQTTGNRLSGALASGIMLVETGVNTGTFEAQGKIYGSTEVTGYSNLRVGTQTGTNVVTLGSLSSPPYASMRIIEANSDGKLGLFYSGTVTASAGNKACIGFASGYSSAFSTFSIGASNWAVAIGTTSTAFGTSTVVNVGTSTYKLHKLIDGANYCTVILDAFTDAATTTTTNNLWSATTGSASVTLDSFILAGPRRGDTIKVSYYDEMSAKYASNPGTITSTIRFGPTGVAGALSVGTTTAGINDFVTITVVDANLNKSPGDAEKVDASTWAGTTTNSRGDLLKVVGFIADSPSTAGSALSGMGSYTVCVSYLDNSSVGTQAVRISDPTNTYVWIVPTITSADSNVRFGVTGTYSAFSLGTLTTSKVALVRGNSANATTMLRSATQNSFAVTTDAVNDTVEVSPDGTRWIAVPMFETGANSSTFTGTIGFDYTAVRLTTNTTTSITTLISSSVGTSSLSFQGLSLPGNGLQDVFGTGSVVRVFDDTFNMFAEVYSPGTTTLSVRRLPDFSLLLTPSKTYVQLIGNDMAPERMGYKYGGQFFRIGGYYGATYRVRYNDALGAGNVYSGGDTLAITTSNVGFTTYLPKPQIAAGDSHTISLKSDGTVWAWGNNGDGQLGDGTAITSYRGTPVQVSGLSSVTAIAGGSLHTIALKSDGTVWAWGYNGWGELGDGTTTNRSTPVQVSGLSSVTAIAGGGGHTIALKSDGTVWAWGKNNLRQLGVGTTTASITTPMQVSGLSGVTAIAGGGGHTIALKSDGTVWAWGENGNGQLGDGTTTDRTTPVQVSNLNGVTAIAGGGAHTIALKSDGTVWVWGQNDKGQLGDGTTTQRTTPVQVSGLSGVTAIAGGSLHTIALKSDGTAWAWGMNYYGALGDGTTTNRSTPVQVSGLSGVTAIAGGQYFTIAMKSDGTVWAWGDNYYGQLGDGTTTYRRTPVQTSNFNVSYPTVTTGAATGVTASSATLNGTVTANGFSTTAWFNYGTSSGSYTGTSSTQAVSGTSSTAVSIGISGLSASTTYYYRITGQGSYGTSYGSETSFATPDTTAPTITITSPTSDTTYSTTSSSLSLGGAASDTGSGVSSVTWSNNRGGSGTASGTASWSIAGITLSPGGNVITVTAIDGSGNTATDTITVTYTLPTVTTGSATSVTLSTAMMNASIIPNGATTTVWFQYGASSGSYTASVGTTTISTYLDSGTHGVSGTLSSLTPWTTYYYRAVAQNIGGTSYGSETSFTPMPQVAGGYFHTVALKTDGTVWTWGRNNYGQLGNGTYATSTTPVQVSGLADVIAVNAGDYHSVALKSDGTVWAWGANFDGQLGNGTYATSTTPLQVSGLNDVLSIEGVGGYHNVVIGSGTAALAWGGNLSGQLGNGTSTASATPVQVSGLTGGVMAVWGGIFHSLALVSSGNGNVYTWGSNYYGQLGNGTTTDTNTPAYLSSFSSAGTTTAVRGGWFHSLALRPDGTVWAWGRNAEGQLGTSTAMGTSTTPIQVTGISGASAIAVGDYHSAALKPDGTVWSWGGNFSGQLGNGSTTDSSAPVQASGLSNIVFVGSTNGNFGTALKSDGTVWSWGDNLYGQLGNGTTTNSNIPAQVSGLNLRSPTVTTGTATGVGEGSATLNGTVNANGTSTTAWFNYGTTSGVYTGTSTTQAVSGTSSTSVSIGISGLSAGTAYYCRLAGQNGYGTSYGAETSLTTSSPAPPPPVTFSLTVTSTSPTGGATGVAVNAAISATFNDTMNGSSLTTDTFKLSGGGSNVGGSVSTGGATATFTPSSNLSYNTTYTVTITTGAKAANAAQSTLSTDYSWSFTTASAPPAPTPSATPVSTATPAPTPASTPTAIPSPVATSTATPTPAATPKTTPSVTPSPTATAVPSPSPTPTKAATPTPVATPSPTPSPSATPAGGLSLSKEVAYLSGDTVVATVVDSGRNTRSGAADVLTTALKVKGENYYSGADLLLDLNESGINSGTFLATIRTGTDTSGGAGLSIRANAGVIKAVQGGTATVAYTGTATAATLVKTLAFSSFDATLAFGADAYPVGSYAVITHADAEENADHSKVETLLGHLSIETSSFNRAFIKLVETGADTGTFKGSIQISSTATLDYERIQASEGGTLTASCMDDINTSGFPRTVTAKSRVIAAATPMTTPTAMPSPTPTVTPKPSPTPGCAARSLSVSHRSLKLKRGEGADVTVSLTGAGGCKIEGETVEAVVMVGKAYLSVSPSTETTDEDGNALFTITAKRKTGKAQVRFRAGGLKKSLTVKVRK